MTIYPELLVNWTWRFNQLLVNSEWGLTNFWIWIIAGETIRIWKLMWLCLKMGKKNKIQWCVSRIFPVEPLHLGPHSQTHPCQIGNHTCFFTEPVICGGSWGMIQPPYTNYVHIPTEVEMHPPILLRKKTLGGLITIFGSVRGSHLLRSMWKFQPSRLTVGAVAW